MNPDSKLTLVLKKSITSTAERAFKVFTNPDEMSRWFTTEARAELTVGGKYYNADGDHGEFIHINQPHEVEFTWENANHCPGTVVRVYFIQRSRGEIVDVTLKHAGLASPEDFEDMKGGWSWALESFKSYIETGKPISYEDWLRATKKEDE